MSTFVVATIVEGHGEVEALPVLIRRLEPVVMVPRPVRAKRQKIVKPGELERYARIAEANVLDHGGNGAVLLVLDADDDCAATRGPELAKRLHDVLPHRPTACAFAVRQFESWLIAGDHQSPHLPDERRGGKAWIATHHGRYVETVDQPRLAATFDLGLASSRSRSFSHLVSVLRRLLEPIDEGRREGKS